MYTYVYISASRQKGEKSVKYTYVYITVFILKNVPKIETSQPFSERLKNVLMIYLENGIVN